MGLFRNNNKKKNNEFKQYAGKLIGNDENDQPITNHDEVQIDRGQQDDILAAYKNSQQNTPEQAMPASNEENYSANEEQVHNITGEAEEVETSDNLSDKTNKDVPTDSNNMQETFNNASTQEQQDDYTDGSAESANEANVPNDYNNYNASQENTTTDTNENYSETQKYELTPEKLPTVNNVIENNYIFDVDAAFVDWFANDLPVTAGENGLDNLRNRKIIAMHSLTKTYLRILITLSSDEKQRTFDDLTPDEIDKLNLSKGGFLTIYSDYIYKNIDYLLTAIRFYNGSVNDVENSNWHETNTSDYLQKLYSLAIHGSEYVHDHNSDYENAIVRMSKGVKNGNIRLDRD